MDPHHSGLAKLMARMSWRRSSTTIPMGSHRLGLLLTINFADDLINPPELLHLPTASNYTEVMFPSWPSQLRSHDTCALCCLGFGSWVFPAASPARALTSVAIVHLLFGVSSGLGELSKPTFMRSHLNPLRRMGRYSMTPDCLRSCRACPCRKSNPNIVMV